MIGPDVYESPRATYVSGGGGGGGLVGKQAVANSPNMDTTKSRRPVTKPPPDGRNVTFYHPARDRGLRSRLGSGCPVPVEARCRHDASVVGDGHRLHPGLFGEPRHAVR